MRACRHEKDACITSKNARTGAKHTVTSRTNTRIRGRNACSSAKKACMRRRNSWERCELRVHTRKQAALARNDAIQVTKACPAAFREPLPDDQTHNPPVDARPEAPH